MFVPSSLLILFPQYKTKTHPAQSEMGQINQVRVRRFVNSAARPKAKKA